MAITTCCSCPRSVFKHVRHVQGRALAPGAMIGVTWLTSALLPQPKKLGFSNLTHLRRRRSDESTDYVCPVDASSPQAGPATANGVQARPYAAFRGLSPILDREADPSREKAAVQDSRAESSPWRRRRRRGSCSTSVQPPACLFWPPPHPPSTSPTRCLMSGEIQRCPGDHGNSFQPCLGTCGSERT